MYIEFSQRFADKFVENDTEEMWTSLDRAMYAAVDGVHVVSCETRSCAEQMAEKARAQSKGKLCSFLLAIKENIIDLHAVRSLMSFYIIISSDSTTNLQQSILTADCIAVGIDFSCLGTFWQKTRLLAEDSYDCVFYHWICTHEQRKQRELANVMIQLESTNGGGAGLYDEYNRLTQEKRAILCFADSDKKCPSDPMGSTAKKFSVNDIMMLSEYHVLNACELENLFFSSVLSSNLNIGKNTSSIDNIISSKEEIFPEIRMFFDVKNKLFSELVFVNLNIDLF